MADFPKVESVLMNRWQDAVAFREAMGDFEVHVDASLKEATESLRPWLREQGFEFLEVEPKYACLNIARSGWINSKTKQPWVWFVLDAVLPYGYRKVQEDRPGIWLDTRNLGREDRSAFQGHLLARLGGREAEWVTEDCNRDYPVGRHLAEARSDAERLALALEPEAFCLFMKQTISPILTLGDDVEMALRATLGK